MSRYVPKTWKNRTSQYPTRRRLSIIQESAAEMVADVSREEGSVTQIGDMFSASTMNDLETRIDNAFGLVDDDFESRDDEISDIVNVYGAKNLISYPYYETTKTVNGVTFTDNGDGTITVNTPTSASTDTYFTMHSRFVGEANSLVLDNGDYILTGCPSGGTVSTYSLQIGRTYNGTYNEYGKDIGNGLTVTLNGDDWNANRVEIQIQIAIKSGTTVSNKVFKPMLRLASIQDSTYEPYAKTNQQLTLDSVDWDDYSQVGAVNYLPCDAVTTTSSGVTFTVNDDKSVTVVVASTPSSAIYLDLHEFDSTAPFIGKVIKVSGCPSGGGANTYSIVMTNIQPSVGLNDSGEGAIGLYTNNGTGTKSKARIKIGTNCPAGTYVFKPMITPILDYNGPYVPYAKTNRELTEDVTTLNSALNGLIKIKSKTFSTVTQANGACEMPSQITTANNSPIGFKITLPSGITDLGGYFVESSNDKWYLMTKKADGTLLPTNTSIKGTVYYL